MNDQLIQETPADRFPAARAAYVVWTKEQGKTARAAQPPLTEEQENAKTTQETADTKFNT